MKLNTYIIAKTMLLENTCFTYNTIAKKTSLSNKTIRNSMDLLDDYFSQFQLELIRTPGVGIELAGSDESRSTCLKDVMNHLQSTNAITSKTRKNVLIFKLLTSLDPLHMTQLESTLFVTRPSIYNDLKALKDFFATYQIEIIQNRKQGIYLKTGEKRRRHCLLDYYFLMQHEDIIEYQNYPELVSFLNISNNCNTIQTINSFMIETSKHCNSFLTETNLQRATIFLYIAIEETRIHRYVSLNDHVLNQIQNSIIYDYVKNHIHILERKFLTIFNQDEIVYIAAQLSTYITSNSEHRTIDTNVLTTVLNEVYLEFSKYLFYIDKKELFDALTPLLNQAYQSSKFEFDIYLPNASSIIEANVELYAISLTINPILSKYLKFELPQTAVALITLILATMQEHYAQEIRCAYVANKSSYETNYHISYLKSSLPNMHIDIVNTITNINLNTYDLFITNQTLHTITPCFAIPIAMDIHYIDLLLPTVLSLREKKRQQYILQTPKGDGALKYSGVEVDLQNILGSFF